MPAIGKLRCQRTNALQRLPVALGDNHHRAVKIDDFLDARHCQCWRGIDRSQLAVAHRRHHDRRDAHVRQGHVDAVNCAAIDFCRDVEAGDVLADEFIIGARFQRRIAVERPSGGGFGEFAIAHRFARLGVRDDAVRGRQLARRNTHPAGGFVHQRQPRRGTRDAHPVLPGKAHGRRSARNLQIHRARKDTNERFGERVENILMPRHLAAERATEREIGERLIGGRVHDFDFRPVGIKFFGHHLRQRGQ